MVKSGSTLRHSLHVYYRIIVLFAILTYNIQFVCRVIQVRDSTSQIVDTLFVFLTFVNSTGKFLIFNIRRERVDRLIETINGPLFAPCNEHHDEIMKGNAARMLRLLNFYLNCIFVCGTLWTIFPLLNRYLGENVEFYTYFPFDTSQSPTFELVVAYNSILTTFLAYGTTAMDCAIVSLYDQARTQLQTLNFNLEHLMDPEETPEVVVSVRESSAKSVFKEVSSETYKFTLRKRFLRCIKHHQRILWFVKEVESIFGEAMILQFLIISWVICMTLYKIVALRILSVEFVSMAMYLFCMLLQLFFFCYCGTQLTEESELVNQSIYNSEWTSLSPPMQRQLFLMMVCARPVSPCIAYIVPMSMETFIPIIKFSYTLLTLLNQT